MRLGRFASLVGGASPITTARQRCAISAEASAMQGN